MTYYLQNVDIAKILDMRHFKFFSSPSNAKFHKKSENYSKQEMDLSVNPPQSLLLTDIKNESYKLKRMVVLSVEETEDEYFIVYDNIVNQYGVGENIEDAVEEYTSMLLDLFTELNSSANILSPNLEMQLEYLKSVFDRR